jgi:hypothetical protein
VSNATKLRIGKRQDEERKKKQAEEMGSPPEQ